MPTLDWIRFNHDFESASHDAINIRVDAALEGFSADPEWRRGISREPDDSVAAYAGVPIDSNGVTIRVGLTRAPNDPQRIVIRARDLDEWEKPEGCAGLFRYFFFGAIESAVGNINILGAVSEALVDFGSGDATEALVEPTRTPAGVKVGVRSGITRWQWEWRADDWEWRDDSAWQPLEQTRHRIYSLLDVPREPWAQLPYARTNIRLPWARALAHAVGWAHMSGDAAMAARRVTEQVNGLDRFQYNCGPMPRQSVYCDGSRSTPNDDYSIFYISEFLDRLERRSEGLGPWLNCSDCASIVVTMANLVGCDLIEGQLKDPRVRENDQRRTFAFPINDLMLIGHSDWTNACGVTNFNYHEVAWSGLPGPNGLVYDACAAVDGDSDPRNPPHTRLLATGERFGDPGEMRYRDRLSPPDVSEGGVPDPRPEGAGWRRII